jgi:transposase
MSQLLHEALPVSALVVAVDPGKVAHRVWLSTGADGLVAEPRTLPVLREGLDELGQLIRRHAGGVPPVVMIEATGSLHQAWMAALAQRFPGCVRLAAPSETTAARTQLGSRRFKTDDRDCAALTYLARQGQGRLVPPPAVDSLHAAVRYRRGLVAERKVAQQRLHDQLNALCPGLSAPEGQGRSLRLEGVAGQAVLDAVADFAGRAAPARSLRARARGRFTGAEAEYWARRWRSCLPPPADAGARADRLRRSIARWRAIQADIAVADAGIAVLLATTDGQILTTLPGVKTTRAAAFAAFTLPIERFPTPEHLYSATGLAPARYQSASIGRRRQISRQGLAGHRDALMAIAWGLSQHSPAFRDRDQQLRARGMAPMEARVALARHACRLCYAMIKKQEGFGERRYRRNRHQPRAVTASTAMPRDGET